jgi:hypothetical protein
MRTLVVAITLLFSISLADANQQALLRVQWKQLEVQNHMLTGKEKLERVQALSTLIKLNNYSPTKVSQTPADIFESGFANEAEIAFSKWVMFKELGLDADQFRLVYVQEKENKNNHVWLAKYDDEKVTLITLNDVVSRDSLVNKFKSEVNVLSVVDPKVVYQHRVTTRSSAVEGQQNGFL